jgi:histidinol-phosphate aminotransferase
MADYSPDQLANQNILDLVPYQPGKPIEELVRERGISAEKIVKLASNENPLGMSPKAAEAASAALAEGARYPEQYDLAQAVAAHTGLPPEMVLLGNGSNDILDFVARVFLKHGDESIISQYAFLVYELATRAAGGNPVFVPATADYGHDLGAMLAAITEKTRVLWVANPNNPTGTFIPYAKIKEFLAKVPERVIVVLDEAYYEYLPPGQREDTTKWLTEHPNLILTRTFSKVYGLAGLRIGYGLMHPSLALLLNRVRPPFNVNRAGGAAAVASLQDTAFVQESFECNMKGRAQLLDGLGSLGYETIGREGNFVTFRAGTPKETVQLNDYLLSKGVIVRPLANYGLGEFLRATIGTAAENQALLTALAAAPKQQQ